MKKNYSLILRKIIFAFNSISVIGIAIFILYTTRKICDAYVASDFLEKVNAIPANPSALVGEILVLVAIMGISFICREKFVRENTGVYYLTLLIDFCASFFIVYRLDFNYNGILLWVFANLIAHIKDMGGKYVLAVISLLSYIGNGDGVIDQFGTYNYTWKEAVYSNGAELFDKDGKKAFFSGTKVNEAVKFVKKLNEMNGGREVTQNDFDSGNVAFMPLAFSEYRTYKTYPYKIKKYTSFQWDCTSMPAGPGGHNTSEVDALLMTIGNKSKHKELAWEFLKMLTSDSSIQREIFEYSQGASVLKYVTGSRYAESMIRKDMDVDERGIDNRLLSDAIENGRINPKFSKYPEAMALAENEIDDIYKNEKNIDSSLKVFQRSITKFLNQ